MNTPPESPDSDRFRDRALQWLARRGIAPDRISFDDPAQFESSRFLLKWIVIGSLIGVVAGLGALAFSWAIEFSTDLFLGHGAGYIPPMPVGEGDTGIMEIGRPWMIPVVTTLGGLLAGFIVFRWAPEAEGHGTDAAIEAIHHKRAEIDPRIPPIKLIASAITIGSGGSAGREGPTAQISSGFASMLTTWLKLSPEDRRIAVSAGMGAGIGAIFRAPLGGALMSAEILYLHDLEVEVLLPALISSIVGYSVYGYFSGWDPIFGAQPGLGFSDPVTLVWYVVLGLILGLGGLLYSRTFYGVQGVFHRLRVPLWIKPGIGGLLVGLMGLWVAGSLHTGYGWVQMSMTDEIFDIPLWTILVLPFAKILATSFSVGSGGSGGIFGPGMVIGGMLGAAVWRLGDGVVPHMPDSPAPFVIIGMMGLFGSIAHAPFAVMLMVAEMTGNLSLLAPAMITVAVATALVGDATIYRSQLVDRTHAPAHRIRMSFPLLSALSARDAMRSNRLGEVGANPMDGITVDASTPLDDAMQQLAESGESRAIVVDAGRRVGEITNRDALAAYKLMLQRGVRRARALPASSLIVEGVVRRGSPLAGRPLRDAHLPEGALVVSVRRHRETIYPTATTVLQAGDLATFLTPPGNATTVHALLEGRDRGTDEGSRGTATGQGHA
jgi:chloride channel protein, CIC family